MLFHEALARSLRDRGLTTIFGLIGDGNLFIMDSFRRLEGTRYLPVANESAAVLAAIGYAHTCSRLGIATVTHGPALTNTVTALVEGTRARMPVLVLAGDTPVANRDHPQNIEQRAIVLAAGAGFEQVRTAETLGADLTTAIRRAHVERRPVVLNIPAEFQWADIEPLVVTESPVADEVRTPDAEAINRAFGVIASARRPVVLAGRGAMSTAARTALLRLAARIGAPVATTLKARDLFRGEPYNLGVFGTLSHEIALDHINRSDCIIAFGAALNKRTSLDGSLLSKASLVHIDAYREQLGRYVVANAEVAGDAALVAEVFVAMLDEAEIPPTEFASAELAAKLAAYDPWSFRDQSNDRGIDIRTALLKLDDAFPQDRNLVFDGGRYLASGYRWLHVKDPHAFVSSINFGSIGLGMATAIGASIGASQRPTLFVCGDGGFMLGGLTEFNTAVRNGIDIVVAVMNDGAFGAEHVQFTARNLDPVMSTFEWPDLGPVATALGATGYTVRTAAELDRALGLLGTRTGPVLIDIKLDPYAIPED